MRSLRTLVAALALALVATTALTAPSASARDEDRQAVVAAKVAAGPDAGPSARGAYTITSKVVKKRLRPNRPKQLVLQGTVTPAKGPVYVQRATRCNRAERTCNFTFYRKVFLKRGAYQALIDAPPTQRSWLWRAKVGTSYSAIWQTCTKRPAQSCRIPY